MTNKHTPTPYKLHSYSTASIKDIAGFQIRNKDDETIIDIRCTGGFYANRNVKVAKETCKFIVRTCNTQELLIDHIERFIKLYEKRKDGAASVLSVAESEAREVVLIEAARIAIKIAKGE